MKKIRYSMNQDLTLRIVVTAAWAFVGGISRAAWVENNGNFATQESVGLQTQNLLETLYVPGDIYAEGSGDEREIIVGEDPRKDRIRMLWRPNTDDGVIDTWDPQQGLHPLRISGRPLVLTGGPVGIGTTNPQTDLEVNGEIKAKDLVVESQGADYVFKDDYELMPLRRLEEEIKANGHLPGFPTAQEMMEKGVKVGEIQVKLLEKIEELTLYLIEQGKEIDRLKRHHALLKHENEYLRKQVPGFE